MKKHCSIFIVIGILFFSTITIVSATSQSTLSEEQNRPTYKRCFLFGRIDNFTVDGSDLIIHTIRVRGMSWTYAGFEGFYIFRNMNVRISMKGASVYYSPTYMMGFFHSTPVIVS